MQKKLISSQRGEVQVVAEYMRWPKPSRPGSIYYSAKPSRAGRSELVGHAGFHFVQLEHSTKHSKNQLQSKKPTGR